MKILLKIYPVIHFLNQEVAFDEAKKASDAGADGVFLISHRADDVELCSSAKAVQARHPELQVGVNFLTMGGLDSVRLARKLGFPMVWGDDLGVSSKEPTDDALTIAAYKSAASNDFDVFASVAFKYRPHEPDPALAAINAKNLDLIPTTSGSATGSAPELEKIIAMSKATGGLLAVASGMTPENVAQYAPYLSHILVATGVAQDEHRMDKQKLMRLIVAAREARMARVRT